MQNSQDGWLNVGGEEEFSLGRHSLTATPPPRPLLAFVRRSNLYSLFIVSDAPGGFPRILWRPSVHNKKCFLTWTGHLDRWLQALL